MLVLALTLSPSNLGIVRPISVVAFSKAALLTLDRSDLTPSVGIPRLRPSSSTQALQNSLEEM